MDVHTTYDEIVEVKLSSPPKSKKLADCLVEATWRVRLSAAFDLEREAFRVALP